ncbi:hypothetical protein BJV78DRAFT_378338 [Lactifluus subvellereus]|nr:hypothetical protein BJV78DRAFT_378338 [Lactifluus subvellereus]
MERHAQRARLVNAFHNIFRRGHSSSSNGQVNSSPEGDSQLQSSAPGHLDQGPSVTSLPDPAASHALDEDVEMLLADPSSDMHFTIPHTSHPAANSPQLSSSPPTSALATSSPPIDLEAPHPPHFYAHAMDDDAHSVTSMPPLYDASDSESEEGHLYHGVYDFMSESEADAHDVEMTLLIDEGDFSDHESAVFPRSTLSAAAEDSRDLRHVTVEEVQDQDQQRTGPSDTIPLASNEQPGPSSHSEAHPHWYPHPHPPILLHPQPHLHHHPQPHPPHPLYSQQPPAGVHLPTFLGMPGLRAQGQVEGRVPLPGLRTLFQPLIVEAVAQAGERLRAAQATGDPNVGQGPVMGPAASPDAPAQGANRTGLPFVQVVFDVPMFRMPADAQPRPQQQTEVPLGVNAQRPADQTFEDGAENPNPAMFDLNPGAFTPNPTADAMPAPLRQLFEALDFHPDAPELPPGDRPQNGAAPAWTGLLGLLFGLGLGASPELNREDPARAKRLVNGLEAVNTGLVKRMRKIGDGNTDGAVCAVCWDALLEEDAEIRSPGSAAGVPVWDAPSDRGQATSPEPGATNPAEPEEPLPKVVALPCSHVFHGACLVPWFSRPKQTTCPTCRFNVDPDNLTYETPRRPQTDHPQSTPPHPATPQQEQQDQQGPSSGFVPPLNQAPQAPQQQDGHAPHPPPLRRTIFEHTFTIPFPPPAFPPPHPQPPNPSPQSQAETRQQGPIPQGPFPMPPGATDPFSPLVFQRALHNLRQFSPHTQPRPQQPPNGAPAQDGPTPTPTPLIPQQTQPLPPAPGQGLQPPPQDGQRNPNGMPRFPGLFQFELPQPFRTPDGQLFWSVPLGTFRSPTPTPTAGPQAPPRPPVPKRTWAPPPPPGLTLRQRVEKGEREQGLRCDDMSCGLGPSDDDPEPMADLARVVIHSLGDGASVCAHTFHPACLVSAERVAGWGPDDERERERAGGLVEVSCPVCRAVGAVPREDWEKGALALV